MALPATVSAFVIASAVMFLTGDAVLASLYRIKDQRIWIAPWSFAVVVWPIATPILVAFAFVNVRG